VLKDARNLHPFNQMIAQPTIEHAITAADLDALAEMLAQDANFATSYEGKKTSPSSNCAPTGCAQPYQARARQLVSAGSPRNTA